MRTDLHTNESARTHTSPFAAAVAVLLILVLLVLLFSKKVPD